MGDASYLPLISKHLKFVFFHHFNFYLKTSFNIPFMFYSYKSIIVHIYYNLNKYNIILFISITLSDSSIHTCILYIIN